MLTTAGVVRCLPAELSVVLGSQIRPATLSVRAGDTVVWSAPTNGLFRYTVARLAGGWSGEVGLGSVPEQRVTFAEPGIYTYRIRFFLRSGQRFPYQASYAVYVRPTAPEDSPVLINSPVEGIVFTFNDEVGEEVLVLASYADDPVLVERVDFYAGDVLLGSALAPPYQTGFKSQAAGRYRLVAKAVLRDGRVQESAPVNIEMRRTVLPILFPPQALPSGGFLFYYTPGYSEDYVLERSTDLVLWEPLWRMTPSAIWADVADERRAWFYRARPFR